jgi:predicted HicB family RNase H-like nuclease
MEVPKARQVYEVALALFRTSPDWVDFFREMLGLNGVARIAFPDLEEMAEFEQSEEFAAIQQMIAKLREAKVKYEPPCEPTRMITIRIPQSLHETLQAEAYDHRTSMNKLCISKLLQIVDEELVPSKKPARPLANAQQHPRD